MNNLGIYITTLEYNDDTQSLVKTLHSLDNKYNISLFYDNVSNFPVQVPCGIFSSTDIWNFSGLLVLTDLEQVDLVMNIVNDINVYYWYKKEDHNIFDLIRVADKVPVIAADQESAQHFLRVTGVPTKEVVERYNIEGLTNTIGLIREKEYELDRL